MSDICTDNRFEVIEEYKQRLINSTNIETSPNEMAVIDNILFRFWQMGWIPTSNTELVKHGKWIKLGGMQPPEYQGHYACSCCNWCAGGKIFPSTIRLFEYCPSCGAKMEWDD